MEDEQMSQSIEKLHGELIGYLKEGKFAEGIEDFYAPDVTAQENNAPPTKGREALAANERTFLEKVTAYRGIEVLGTAVDDQGDGSGTVFYEAVMQWTQSDIGEVSVQQAVVERWHRGKVQSLRFYGDFGNATTA
jgi:hypothetical protein